MKDCIKEQQILDQWLLDLQKIHCADIDLGLERISQVWESLQMPIKSPVITVAGTNGKGSSVSYLESIYLQAGYSTGVFTSPHLIHYTERIKISGVNVSPDVLNKAFAAIETQRAEIPLTEFEFSTLAALWVFNYYGVDVLILEVGLGGRLDAVNIIDADVALITALSIDHVDWLGDNLSIIAQEKAGIMRSGALAVYSGDAEQTTLKEYAHRLGTKLYVIGEDFSYDMGAMSWSWESQDWRYNDLTRLVLPGEHQIKNASGVLMTVNLLLNVLAVSKQAVITGLSRVAPRGRFQQIQQAGTSLILDVAHNPHAAQMLAQCLVDQPVKGRTLAVCGMLKDKDIEQVLLHLKACVDIWYIGSIDGVRGANAMVLSDVLDYLEVVRKTLFTTIDEAFDAAIREAEADDRVLIFGSFMSVSTVMNKLVEIK